MKTYSDRHKQRLSKRRAIKRSNVISKIGSLGLALGLWTLLVLLILPSEQVTPQTASKHEIGKAQPYQTSAELSQPTDIQLAADKNVYQHTVNAWDLQGKLW